MQMYQSGDLPFAVRGEFPRATSNWLYEKGMGNSFTRFSHVLFLQAFIVLIEVFCISGFNNTTRL